MIGLTKGLSEKETFNLRYETEVRQKERNLEHV